MHKYSNILDPCTENVGKNSDDYPSGVDFSELDLLEWELNNMNGRASVTPPPRDAVGELAAIEAALNDLIAELDE